MDAGCTCCCTCSTGFNNNPTGRKNRWHTFNTSNHTSFLADEAYTITIHMCLFDSQILSTCQQTPRCEPDAILFLELPTLVNSLIGSLCCLEQMLRVTQATGMLFRSDASKKEQKDKSKNKKQEAREEKTAKEARRQLAQGARARSQNKASCKRKKQKARQEEKPGKRTEETDEESKRPEQPTRSDVRQ